MLLYPLSLKLHMMPPPHLDILRCVSHTLPAALSSRPESLCEVDVEALAGQLPEMPSSVLTLRVVWQVGAWKTAVGQHVWSSGNLGRVP